VNPKEVWFDSAKNLLAVAKHGYVHLNVPVHQCARLARVLRAVTRDGAQPHAWGADLLQPVQRLEQRFERPSAAASAALARSCCGLGKCF
jgi:hypothetical protein